MKGRRKALRPIEADRHFGSCKKCGRVRYASKRTAKAAARQLHPGQHLRAFQCGHYWHFGPHTAAKKSHSFQGAQPTLVIVDEATCLPWEAS